MLSALKVVETVLSCHFFPSLLLFYFHFHMYLLPLLSFFCPPGSDVFPSGGAVCCCVGHPVVCFVGRHGCSHVRGRQGGSRRPAWRMGRSAAGPRGPAGVHSYEVRSCNQKLILSLPVSSCLWISELTASHLCFLQNIWADWTGDRRVSQSWSGPVWWPSSRLPHFFHSSVFFSFWKNPNKSTENWSDDQTTDQLLSFNSRNVWAVVFIWTDLKPSFIFVISCWVCFSVQLPRTSGSRLHAGPAPEDAVHERRLH